MQKTNSIVLLGFLLIFPALADREFGNGGNEIIKGTRLSLNAFIRGRLSPSASKQTISLWSEQLSVFGNLHLLERDELTFLGLPPSVVQIQQIEVNNGTSKSLYFAAPTLFIDAVTKESISYQQWLGEISEIAPRLTRHLYPESNWTPFYTLERSAMILGLTAQPVKALQKPHNNYWICYRSLIADLLKLGPDLEVSEEKKIISILSKAEFSTLINLEEHPSIRLTLAAKQRVYKKFSKVQNFIALLSNEKTNISLGDISESTQKQCPFMKGWVKE